MKHRIIVTASAFVLLAMPASAQNVDPKSSPAQEKSYPDPSEIVPTPKAPPTSPNVPPALIQTKGSIKAQLSVMPTSADISAGAIRSTKVYTLKPDAERPPTESVATLTLSRDEYGRLLNSHQQVGEIEDLLISGDGRINNTVISVGGFLGVGERQISVPWSEIRFIRSDEGENFAIISKTKADLEKMPEYRSPLK